MQGFKQIFLKYFFNACFRPILDINNMPLFAGKGMLLGNKVGLFLMKESLFRGGSGGRDGKRLYCNIEYCIHIYIAGYERRRKIDKNIV